MSAETLTVIGEAVYNIGAKWRNIRRGELCSDIFRKFYLFIFFGTCSDGGRAAEKGYLR